MALASGIVVCVKAAVGAPDIVGDCPFCHRVLITLEEKKVPYSLKLVNLSNKPKWFLDMNPGGKVPVYKAGEEADWVPDSDVIVNMIEDKYPVPPLTTLPEYASVGSKVFSCLNKFIKSKNPSDGSEQELLDELKAIDEHLEKIGGPYIAGANVSAVDFGLVPKLHHLEISLGHFKGWTIPEEMKHLHAYMKTMFEYDSFVKTMPKKEHVIAGWELKLSAL